MSMTMYSFLANKDFDEIPFQHLLISLNDPTDHELIREIVKEFK